jgi:hypothetical protein
MLRYKRCQCNGLPQAVAVHLRTSPGMNAYNKLLLLWRQLDVHAHILPLSHSCGRNIASATSLLRTSSLNDTTACGKLVTVAPA